jgi:hypothetical protein
MTDDADSYTQAEIVRLLTRLDTSVTELKADLRRLEQNYVTRSEWGLYKEAYERNDKLIRAEVADVRTATSPVRVSGWMISGFVVSAIVGAGSLIALVLTLINGYAP